MQLNDLTLLTTSFNNNMITALMTKSFYKQIGTCAEIIIIDNGDKTPVDDKLKEIFTVVDNFNHKLLPDLRQCSKNHCLAVDYVLKNVVKTEWVLLCDNDIFFKPETKKFLEDFDDAQYDTAGEVGWDDAPPIRLFPYFCLINVKKFKEENLSYYDPKRITEDPPIGKHFGPRGPGTPCWYHDTGSSFLEDITGKWNILKINLDDYIVHNKTTGMPKMKIEDFIKTHMNLWK